MLSWAGSEMALPFLLISHHFGVEEKIQDNLLTP